MKIKQISQIKSLVIVALGVLVVTGFAYASTGLVKNYYFQGDFIEATDDASLGGITAQIEYFQEGIVEGGLTNEVSGQEVAGATETGTLVSSDICQYKSLEYTYAATSTGIVANTLYLPTSDALINSCLYTENDSWTIYFSNENTAAATTTTLAITSGDDMELLEPDGSDVVIPGGEDAIIHFRNAGSGVVKATVTSVRSGD